MNHITLQFIDQFEREHPGFASRYCRVADLYDADLDMFGSWKLLGIKLLTISPLFEFFVFILYFFNVKHIQVSVIEIGNWAIHASKVRVFALVLVNELAG